MLSKKRRFSIIMVITSGIEAHISLMMSQKPSGKKSENKRNLIFYRFLPSSIENFCISIQSTSFYIEEQSLDNICRIMKILHSSVEA